MASGLVVDDDLACLRTRSDWLAQHQVGLSFAYDHSIAKRCRNANFGGRAHRRGKRRPRLEELAHHFGGFAAQIGVIGRFKTCDPVPGPMVSLSYEADGCVNEFKWQRGSWPMNRQFQRFVCDRPPHNWHGKLKWLALFVKKAGLATVHTSK